MATTENKKSSSKVNEGTTGINRLKWLGAIVLVVFGAIELIVYNAGHNWGERGQIGDMFGVGNAIFSAFAFVGIIVTVWMQRQELELQRVEFETNRGTTNILAKQLKVLGEQLNVLVQQHEVGTDQIKLLRQGLELNSTRIDLQRDQVKISGDEVKIQRKRIKLTQDEVEEQIRQLQAQAETLRVQADTLRKQNRENTFFQLLGFHQDILQNIKYNGVGRGAISQLAVEFRNTFNRIDDEMSEKERIKRAYATFYRNYQSHIGHYFRNLYHILDYINNTQATEVEKELYGQLVRAQLSSEELILLFYNCLSDLGPAGYQGLIENYSMLQFVPRAALVRRDHIDFYRPRAFGRPEQN